jgi:opacity protein-like surface antigen
MPTRLGTLAHRAASLPVGFALAASLALPVPARAQDVLMVPFLGLTFGGDSSFLADLEQGSGETASALGGSLMLLSQSVLGIEADFGWVPGFFERGDRQIVAPGSYVTSLTGNVILAVPLSITRESLRPYVVGGGGLMYAEAEDFTSVFTIRSTMPALTLGGGAIGFLSDTVGVRFDVRYLRSLGQGDEQLAGEGPRVKFWRLGIGLVLKY